MALKDEIRYGDVPRPGPMKADGLAPGDLVCRYDAVLLERERPEEKTAGGLIIPDVAKLLRVECRVLGCGPDVRDCRACDGQKCSACDDTGKELRPGQRIILSKWGGGLDFSVGKHDYLLVSDHQITAFIAEGVQTQETPLEKIPE